MEIRRGRGLCEEEVLVSVVDPESESVVERTGWFSVMATIEVDLSGEFLPNSASATSDSTLVFLNNFACCAMREIPRQNMEKMAGRPFHPLANRIPN
jgi:hypothetical protein